jgi:DNA-binding NtrC family response regulator
MARILVVDDDRAIRRTLEMFLRGEGHQPALAADAQEATTRWSEAELVLLDLGLPGGDGLELLQRLGQRTDGPSVIIITARDDLGSTVRGIQLGAYDYLVKPLDIEGLRATIDRALATRVARVQAPEPAAERGGGPLIGQSPPMRALYKTIGAVSLSKATVLLRGESGTGKELVARAIHQASPSADQPFMAINCSAISRDLLESELFGHVRGAFTGAAGDKAGRFELAGSGTLFLDEIGELSADLQAKLLRVIQERTYERVGDGRPQQLRARIIAATHRDLEAMVADGRFRADLLYRLQVLEVRIPALRERRADVPLLVEGLLVRIAREVHKPVPRVSQSALDLLCDHDWPGNVRELENALVRAVVLAPSDVIEAENLPIRPGPGPSSAPVWSLRDVERQHIQSVLTHVSWNKRRACALLGVSRPTLDRKIEEYGLNREAP